MDSMREEASLFFILIFDQETACTKMTDELQVEKQVINLQIHDEEERRIKESNQKQ